MRDGKLGSFHVAYCTALFVVTHNFLLKICATPPRRRRASGQHSLRLLGCAPARIRTWNSSSEDCRDIRFTTRAMEVSYADSTHSQIICADTGNRTPISSLARTRSTTKPYPQWSLSRSIIAYNSAISQRLAYFFPSFKSNICGSPSSVLSIV